MAGYWRFSKGNVLISSRDTRSNGRYLNRRHLNLLPTLLEHKFSFHVAICFGVCFECGKVPPMQRPAATYQIGTKDQEQSFPRHNTQLGQLHNYLIRETLGQRPLHDTCITLYRVPGRLISTTVQLFSRCNIQTKRTR